MLPVETPKLPKWPFLVGDATLLGLAWLVSSQSRTPLTGLSLVTVLVCAVVGAILAVIPFLSDYARRQDEALDDRQRSLDGLARTVAATAEQIGIAANGLHEIAALAQRNLKAAETLTGAIETRTGTVAHPAIADLDRLQAAADKAARAASELARFEAAAQKNFVAASETLARTTAAIETLNTKAAARTLAASIAPFEQPQDKPIEHPQDKPDEKPANTAVDQPEENPLPPRGMPAISVDPFVPPASAAGGEMPELTQAPVANQEPVSVGADLVSDKPKRVRKPREKKPASPEIAANGEAESAIAVATAVLDAPPAADSTPAGATESGVMERIRTSDGATRLIATAYIGIGNRLFIRGEGPGLSWDSGVPLQFVSIGRWRWETADATAPVKFKLYKNDAVECTALGEQSIDPGQQEEITALF